MCIRDSNWSNDLLLLMKATQSAGLKVRFATVFLDQVGNLANAGDVALGHYIAHPYNIEAAGEEGAKFAEDYKAKTGHYPSYTEPQTVIGITFLGEALKQVKPKDGKLSVPDLAQMCIRDSSRSACCWCSWCWPRCTKA